MKKLFAQLIATSVFVCGPSLAITKSKNTFPPIKTGFGIGITGLYLQPSASNLIYAVYTTPLPLTTPNWEQLSIKPQYSPASDLSVRYIFDDHVTQLTLDWLDVSTSDSASFKVSTFETSVAPPYYFGPLAQALTGSSANAKVLFNLDNLNFTIMHSLYVGQHIQVGPFVGISTSYLKQYITANYSGIDANVAPYNITSFNTSKFVGAGPKIGINTAYFFTKHLGIRSFFSGAIVVGGMDSVTHFRSQGSGNPTSVDTSLANISQTKAIPELEGKVELTCYLASATSGATFTVNFGYMFTTFINSINQIVPTALVPGAFNQGTIAIETANYTRSDITLNGPYLTLLWQF